jgi:hypothetical protein
MWQIILPFSFHAGFRQLRETKQPSFSSPLADTGLVSSVQGKAMDRTRRSEIGVKGFELDKSLIVGIDFGTTFTGVGYVYQPVRKTLSMATLRDINDNIRIITNWPSQNGEMASKTPTLLAYTDGRIRKWGARVGTNDSPQFANFKLGLQEKLDRTYLKSEFAAPSEYLTDPDWRHSLLPSKRAVDVATDFLNCVVQYVLNDALPVVCGQEFLLTQRVTYVLTVPAIWSEKAKQLTRQIAIDAGIPSQKMHLITEPEAAAHYCSILRTERSLERGDRFVVCDAGGGTVVTTFSSSWI